MFLSIRKTLKEARQQRLEKDQNDQVFAGSYRSKHFEVSPDAQRIYSDVDKNIDPEKVERSVKSHDKLFALTKRVDATGYSTKQDIEQAKSIIKDIEITINELGLPAHNHLNTVLKHINDKYEDKKDVVDSISDSELKQRFVNVPKDETPEGKDRDVDNIKNHHITRKNAIKKQRYLNVGVDESVQNKDHVATLVRLVPGAKEYANDHAALVSHVKNYLTNQNRNDWHNRTHYAMYKNIHRAMQALDVKKEETSTMQNDIKSLPKALVNAAQKILENQTASEVVLLDEANNPYAKKIRGEKNPKKRKELMAAAKQWADEQKNNKKKKESEPAQAVPVAKKGDDEDESMNARLLKGKLHHITVTPVAAKHVMAVIRATSPKDRLQKTKDIYFSKSMSELKSHLS